MLRGSRRCSFPQPLKAMIDPQCPVRARPNQKTKPSYVHTRCYPSPPYELKYHHYTRTHEVPYILKQTDGWMHRCSLGNSFFSSHAIYSRAEITSQPPLSPRGRRQQRTNQPTKQPAPNLAGLAEDAVPVAQPVSREPLHPRVHESIRVHHEGVEVDQRATVLAALPPAVVAVPREMDHLRLPRLWVVRHGLCV